MGKLIVTDSSGQVWEYPLNKERVTIGRHADNDIPLNDKAVSGHHAVVITILQDSFLEDLDSTNGTQVNGKQIAKHPLSHGDVIAIGRNNLRYEGDGEAGEDDFERTMILKPGQFGTAFDDQVRKAAGNPATTTGGAPGHTFPPIPTNSSTLPPSTVTRTVPPASSGGMSATMASPPSAPKMLMAKLRVASGPNMGKELELSKALTTIGKPGVQVAAITRRADGYYVVHVGGQAGGARPLINGAPLDTQARKLAHGDMLELAGTRMNFLVIS